MAELARSLVSRLRQYLGDRRHQKRQKVSLPFNLSLSSPARSLNGTRRVSVMEGHTMDVSPNGVSLIIPKITLGEHHLVGENRSLNVKLELPDGPVEMQVLPIRYESLEDHETETGYLIGGRIVSMPDGDREKFAEFVSSLTGRRR
jgi:hypothetical protein